ncbi:IclR family transcriptional regulator [Kitasatospora sp. LaBMicrA B282]|uniref:IclR family transcriptional regulator n=1 Tax=Kitasatospora sp. LaBMicrA B282 TaxID=3420949 RepID=UPI003D0CCBA5
MANRVFRVQTALSKLGGKARIGQLAEETGLDDSTVSRIVQSGVYAKHFERVERGVYALTPTAGEVGIQALADTVDFDLMRQVLKEARRATDNGLIFLYARTIFGLGRQCLTMAVGESSLDELGMSTREVLEVTRSLRTGASGRAILAYLPARDQEKVIAESVLPEAGPGVLRDPDDLRDSLQNIRDEGYAIGYQECMKGWNSVAAPFFMGDRIMGSVLMLHPAEKMPQPPAHYIEAIKNAAVELSSTEN